MANGASYSVGGDRAQEMSGRDVTSAFGADIAKYLAIAQSFFPESQFTPPGSATYTPQTISADQIRAIYEQNQLPDSSATLQELKAQRQAALEAQLAALNTKFASARKSVDGAYNTVLQQLGVAGQQVGTGFSDLIRQQGGVNEAANAAVAAARAQQQTGLASAGVQSVGGAQSTASADVGQQALATTGNLDTSLLSSEKGALGQYLGTVAPSLASAGQAGAIYGLEAASAQAAADAQSKAAEQALQDARDFKLFDLQQKVAGMNSLRESLLGGMTANVNARNAASEFNIQQKARAEELRYQANITRENNIRQTALAMYKSNGVDDKTSATLAKRTGKIGVFKNEFQRVDGMAGMQLGVGKDAKGKPLTKDNAMFDENGHLLLDNYSNWSTDRNGGYQAPLAAIAAMQVAGDTRSGRSDALALAQKIASDQADVYGLKKGTATYGNFITKQADSIMADYDSIVDTSIGGSYGQNDLTSQWADLYTTDPNTAALIRTPEATTAYNTATAKRVAKENKAAAKRANIIASDPKVIAAMAQSAAASPWG